MSKLTKNVSLLRRSIGWAALWLVSFAPAVSRATVMLPVDTATLAKRAKAIIRGQVVGQRAIAISGRVWTDTKIKISDSLKGSLEANTVIVVRQPGGETRKLGARVAGAAQFRVGEEVLLMLRPVGSYWVPLEMTQGKFQIYRATDGEQRTRRDFSGVAFATFNIRGQMVLLSDHQLLQAPDATLGELLATIQRAISGGGK